MRLPSAVSLFRSPIAAAAAVLVGVSAVVVALPWVAGEGMAGVYYPHADRSLAPKLHTIELPHLPAHDDWRTARFDPERFLVEWRGYLRVPQPGRYVFVVESGARAEVRVDGRTLVVADAPVGVDVARAGILLPKGSVPISIEYARPAGYERPVDAGRVSVSWGLAGREPRPLAASDVAPTEIAARLAAYGAVPARWALGLGYALPLTWTLALFALTAWAFLRPAVLHVRGLWREEPAAARALAAVLAGSVGVNVLGFWWGLPWGWAVDEVWPSAVSGGSQQWFSGGWFFWYPPFHYYLLAILAAPFEAAARLGLQDINAAYVTGLLFAVNRLVTVVMATATLYLVYRLALELQVRRRSAILAPLLLAVTPTFAYYGKLANLDVPYVFWVVWSVLWVVRAVKNGDAPAYYAFAATAALAVATKDQAYGFYPLPVLWLTGLRLWRRASALPGGAAARWVRALPDPLLLVTAGVGLGVFALAHNVPFNLQGFLAHFELITGPGGREFTLYEDTLGGHAAMLRDAVIWVAWSMGWPSFLASVAGVVMALRTRPALAAAALLPAVSYYLTFIAVILYHHDRFFLGAMALAAPFGGLALGELMFGGRQAWRRWSGGLLIAFLAWRAISVDLLMLRDSRYTVERWVARRGAARSVCYIGPPEFLPRPIGVRRCELPPDWRLIEMHAPAYVVINAEYAARPTASRGREFYRRLRGGEDGYALALRHKSPPGPALLGWSDVFEDRRENFFTNLDKINPEIEVYRRVPP